LKGLEALGAQTFGGNVTAVFANLHGFFANFNLVEQLDAGAMANRAFTATVIGKVFDAFATTVVFGHIYSPCFIFSLKCSILYHKNAGGSCVNCYLSK